MLIGGTCEQLMPYLNSSKKVARNDTEMVVSVEKELRHKIVYFKRHWRSIVFVAFFSPTVLEFNREGSFKLK